MSKAASRRENITVYENYLTANKKLNDRIRNNISGYMDDFNIYSADRFILKEVVLNWPLIGMGIAPDIAEKEVSIFILTEIIDEKRTFEGYFNDVNGSSISMAKEIYSIMIKAAKNRISVYDISNRIKSVKNRRGSDEVSEHMKEIISGYRKIMGLFGIYDMAMIYELYYNCLLEEKGYRKKNVEKADEICRKCSFKTVRDDEYRNVFEMEAAFENLIVELVRHRGVEKKDIAVVTPFSDSFEESSLKEISERIGIEINPLKSYRRLNMDRVSVMALSALAISMDREDLLKEEEIIFFIKNILKEKNSFRIIKNTEEYIKKVKKLILGGVFSEDDESISGDEICKDEKEYGKFSAGRFIKSFFMKFMKVDEDSVKTVSKISELFMSLDRNLNTENLEDFREDISYTAYENRKESLEYMEFCERRFTFENMFRFVKRYVSIGDSARNALENISMDSVIVAGIEEFSAMDHRRKYTVIYDASNRGYDMRPDSALDSAVSYVSGINAENREDVHKERKTLQEEDFFKKACALENSSIFILRSELSILSYEQENEFYYRLMDMEEDRIEY